VFVLAGGLQFGVGAERHRVARPEVVFDLSDTDPLGADLGALEVLGDERRREPDGLEDLRALVRLHRRDAHLRHRLEEAVLQRVPVGGQRLVLVSAVGAGDNVGDGGVREVRVDRVRAVPD